MKLGSPFLAILLVASVTRSWGAAEFKEAEITTIKNMVEHDAGSGAAPAKVNEKIQEKSKVSTAAASMAELTFADSSITRMGSNTQFSFQSKERLVQLEQGTILIHTPPGKGGATVDCGGVTGAVSGTTFMASRDVSGNVMFVLLEGQGGLKVTAGGSTIVIRPGQAASVGAEQKAEAGSGKSDAPGGGAQPEAKAGGAQSDDAAGGAGSGAKSSDAGGAPTTPSSGGESPAPAPARPVEIKVFEVDVKRVVSTSPLVVDFKAELPSAGKIEQTIEVQQAKVQEGKLEKLDVEVVAVKSADGDLLVGAPKVEKEEMVVVNKKVDIMGNSQGNKGENLDIETAAGPGAGGGVAAAPAPRPETPAPSPVAVNPPPVNPGQTAIVPPPSPSKVAVTARVNDVSRPFNQDNPNFGFSITSGSLLAGHSLVSDFLTAATRASGVVGSPYAVNFSNPRIVDGSGVDVSSRYDLTTVAGVLNVLKASPNLVFGSVGSLVFGQSADLVASSLTGSPTLEVVSGPASVVNGKLVANSGTGSVVVRATAAGDQNYNGAFADQTITLAKAGQSVNFTLPGNLTFDEMTSLGATATGAGSVTYELVNLADSSKVSISGGQLKALSGTGTVQVRAVTAGDNNYDVASAIQTITLAKAGQSVSFALPSTLTYNNGTALSASALDSGTVSFSVVSGPATIDGSGRLVANSGTGSVVVRATAAGDQNYNGAFADQTITLAKAGQSVSFALPSTLTYNNGTALSASALDSGTVSFSVVSGPATIDGSGRLVANSGTGSVVVRATAAGDQNYNGAFADQTITLAKAGQSVNFTLPGNLTFDEMTSLGATATGAGSVTYELVNLADSSKVSISGGQLKALSGTGTVQVRAVTAGDNNYDVASAIQTITLAKAGQSVNFTLPGNLTFDEMTSLGATATGAGSVTYELVNLADSSKVSISGGQLKALSGTGTVQVRAVTAGDNNYDVASAIQTITLAKAGQSVSFALPSTLTYNNGTALSASALDSGTVSFSVVSGPATIDGSGRLVANSGTGSVVVRATAAGDQNYNGAFADQTITLAKAGQSVSFALPSTLTYNNGTALSASALDSGTVSFSVVSGPATIDGSGRLVANSGTGSVVVRATAAGDQNYNGAFADQTITLAKAGQSVNFTLPGNLTFDEMTSLGATATGAGSVTYELVNLADSSKVSISGGQLKALSGTGTVQVRAVTAGDNNYDVASAIQTITLAKAGQSVSFALPSTLTYNNGTALSASALDSGTVSFSVVSGPATIDGSGRLVANSGTGSVVVRATAAGDQNYNGAFADQTITLAKAGQSVNFTLPGNLTFDEMTSLGATATGAGSVTYELVNLADSSKVSISGGQLKALSGTGTVQVRAVTAGDNNYDVASAIQTITLAKAGQSVSFALPSTLTYNNGTALSASALDSGTVSFSVVSGPATIDGSGRLVANSGTGSVVVRATAAGDQNYNGAFADQTITLAKAQPVLVAQTSGTTANNNLVTSLSGSFGGSATFSSLDNDGRVSVDSGTGLVSAGRTLADQATIRVQTSGNENYESGSTEITVALNGPTQAALQAANPARRMLQTPAADELAALDKYFYYTAKAAGLTLDAPSGFFATEKSKSLSLAEIETAKLDKLFAGQTSDYFLTGTLTSPATALPEINLNNRDRVIYADKIEINPLVAAGKTITDNVSATIPDGNPAGLARVLDLSKEGLSGGLPWFVESTQLQIAGNDAAFGAFAGDFQAYLRYRSGSGEASTVMLLDRIGTTAVNPDGSDANGLNVTFRDFSDMAIHQAAPTVAGGVITGAYLPDRGNTLLTAGLGPVDSSGQITLGIFDLSAGAAGDLQSWSVGLVQRLGISLENGVGRDFTLAAGDGGLLLKNTFWDLGGTRADFITAGDLFLQANSFFFPGNNLRMEAAGKAELAGVQVMGNATKGSGVAIRAKGDVTLTDTAVKEVGGDLEVASLAGSVELQASKTIGTQEVAGSVNLQAEGKVKMSGTTVVDLDTSAGAKPSVSPVSTASGSGAQNLAVVRSGDSLELRNVVIRGFHGTRLENGAGRVLMSGSAVTQFKIKELTGMAVNADAKIQMAAYDSAGRLEGEMVVENQLPVATELASQINNTITGTLGNTSVHAKDVELAARTVRFNDATIAAMNSITARANTILVQNSFMTVVQNTGMINMYVSSGLVNRTHGTTQDGYLNFAGTSTFRIGNVLNLTIAGSQDILDALSAGQMLESVSAPQAGKVNVLKL